MKSLEQALLERNVVNDLHNRLLDRFMHIDTSSGSGHGTTSNTHDLCNQIKQDCHKPIWTFHLYSRLRQGIK